MMTASPDMGSSASVLKTVVPMAMCSNDSASGYRQ